MKKIVYITIVCTIMSATSWACPSIQLQLTSGNYDIESNTQIQLFKINDEHSNSVVISTQFGNVNNQIGIQAKGAYLSAMSGDLTNPCGPIFQQDICYRIEALYQANNPYVTLRFNSSQVWSSLTLHYEQGVFTVQGGNPTSYALNTCRMCQHDLVIGPNIAYDAYLTECDSWIVTDQLLTIQPDSTVVWDADPANGYIDLNPGFTAAPNTHCFLAQLEDGCGPKNPLDRKWQTKLILQGYWNGSEMTPALYNQGMGNSTSSSDWVNIELKDSNPPFATVASSASLLGTDGWTESQLNANLSGNYYVVIKHRHSLETWSANPISLDSQSSYDFTTGATQAYGQNMISLNNGAFAIYSGDINQDGFIDSFDFPSLDTDIFNGVSSIYVNTDLNGDGFVDSFDFPILDINSYNGMSTVTP